MKKLITPAMVLLFTLTAHLSVKADAVIIGTPVNDVLNLHVRWQLSSPEGADVIEGNWEAFLRLENNRITVGGRHIVNPHPELGEVFASPFLTSVDFGPFFEPVTIMSLLPHGSIHDDSWTVVFSRSNTPGSIIVDLTASHTPEPMTLLLFGTGVAGVAIKTRNRFKKL